MYLFRLCSLLLLFVAAAVAVDNTFPKNSLEEQILALLYKWRKGSIQTKLISLPSLKSIGISGVHSYYEGRAINVEFSIGKMKLTGLSDFSVNKLNVIQTPDILDISAKILVPTLTLYSDTYELVGYAYYVYPLNGFGAMTVVSQNNQVSVKIRFANVDNNYTKIEDLSLNYSIGSVKANLEGSSWPITKVLNNEGVKILESYHEEINQAVRDYVIPYANKYLAQVTPKDFLGIFADITLNSYVVEEVVK